MNLLFCRCCFLLLSIHRIDLRLDLVDIPTNRTQDRKEVEMERSIRSLQSTVGVLGSVLEATQVRDENME